MGVMGAVGVVMTTRVVTKWLHPHMHLRASIPFLASIPALLLLHSSHESVNLSLVIGYSVTNSYAQEIQ